MVLLGLSPTNDGLLGTAGLAGAVESSGIDLVFYYLVSLSSFDVVDTLLFTLQPLSLLSLSTFIF